MQLLLIIISLFVSGFIGAQTGRLQTQSRKVFYGINYYSGHSVVFGDNAASNANSSPQMISIELATQENDSALHSIGRAYTSYGPAIGYMDFKNPLLGKGITISYFLQPVYRLGKNIRFNVKGDIGLGYFTRPYDSISNPANFCYSMKITPYLHISTGISYVIGKKIVAGFSANFNHISNGASRYPNYGFNWLGYGLSLHYYPQNNQLDKFQKPIRVKRNYPMELGIGTMFVPGQGYYNTWKVKRRFMYGCYASLMKQVNRVHALSAGGEIYHNIFINGKDALPGNNKPAVLAGIYIGHAFVFRRIIFSQQIGHFLTNQPVFQKPIFHRWGLLYKINEKFSAGFNLKAQGGHADFIDWRFQYKIF